MRYFVPICCAFILLTICSPGHCEFVSFELGSSKLQASTVTVRVIPAEESEATSDQVAAAPIAKQVVVCSGAMLGDGLVVTYADITAQDEVRITIPGGEQATAQLKVLDHVSGLRLLQTDKRNVPSFAIAKETPNVGAWVLCSAGWGSEKPVVTFGILAGINRAMPGATFPPLLQCDARTADTSNGAPLVNQQGELLGIIVASGQGESESRWTYAVPVKHVQRLIRAQDPKRMIEIKKVRPVVGMHLDLGTTPNSVVVRRVAHGGPAEKAGVREGDRIVVAEETTIRSPYQVIGPLLAKQPGETMKFTLERDGEQHSVEIILGGGTVIQPKTTYGSIVGLQSAGEVGVSRRVFLSADGPPQEELVIENNGAARAATVRQQVGELELQHKAITTYLSALQRMQDKVHAQEKLLAERDAQIEELRTKLQRLQEASAR